MRGSLWRCTASISAALASCNRSIIARPLRSSANTFRIQHTASSYRAFSSLPRQNAAAAAAEPAPASSEEPLITKFRELQERNLVHSNVTKALLRDMNLENMTEVQSATITEALKGIDMYVLSVSK